MLLRLPVVTIIGLLSALDLSIWGITSQEIALPSLSLLFLLIMTLLTEAITWYPINNNKEIIVFHAVKSLTLWYCVINNRTDCSTLDLGKFVLKQTPAKLVMPDSVKQVFNILLENTNSNVTSTIVGLTRYPAIQEQCRSFISTPSPWIIN